MNHADPQKRTTDPSTAAHDRPGQKKPSQGGYGHDSREADKTKSDNAPGSNPTVPGRPAPNEKEKVDRSNRAGDQDGEMGGGAEPRQ